MHPTGARGPVTMGRVRRPAAALCAALLGACALVLAGCSGGDDDGPVAAEAPTPTGAAPGTATRETGPPRAELVASGLDSPVLALSPPGEERLLAVEQTGRVRWIRDGRPAGTYLDLSGLTAAAGEQGLLGMAFHPGFAENGRLFVDLTDRDGDTRVLELTAEPGADRVDPGTAREILAVEQPYPNHNGGHLEFGPDGLLYVGLGDGGSGGDPEERAQDTGTLLGKILRIDVDAADPYGIPPGNPFADGAGGRPEILLVGVRNPWRFSFDPADGDLWIGDVGQGEREEVDRLALDEAPGANLGWDRMEGSLPFEGATAPAGHVPPVAEYGHDEGCSITGGVVDRAGTAGLDGRYVFGDYCAGRLLTLSADGDPGAARPVPGVGPFPELRSFGRDAKGRVLVVAGDSVHRLT